MGAQQSTSADCPTATDDATRTDAVAGEGAAAAEAHIDTRAKVAAPCGGCSGVVMSWDAPFPRGADATHAAAHAGVRADYMHERAACRYQRRGGHMAWHGCGDAHAKELRKTLDANDVFSRDAALLRHHLHMRDQHRRAGHRDSFLPSTIGTSVVDGAQLTVTAPGVPGDHSGAASTMEPAAPAPAVAVPVALPNDAVRGDVDVE